MPSNYSSIPHFSVTIPLYNKAPYVRKAVESVMGQTFADWELWVVDDGSTDGGGEIVSAINDSRVHYHRQENAGVSATRNNGVALSCAPYICFLDADDWWEPTFLEEMARLIARYPDAGIYGTGYTIVDEKRRKTRPSPVGVDHDFSEGPIDYFEAYSCTEAMPLWTGAVCIPKDVFDKVGGFNPTLKMAEDFDLWVRIALTHKVVFLNKSLANYNQDVDIATRAIGSLPDPKAQFAFNADYLKPLTTDNPKARQVVEWVQIVCLKQYYLSKQYHKQAKTVLDSIDMTMHRGKPYTAYLRRPVWQTRMILNIHKTINRLKWANA